MTITPALIIQPLQSNHYVLLKQAQGVTHTESVKQPLYKVNCFNWVLGHIIQHRDVMLELLGAEPVLTPEESEFYKAGSPPVNEGDDVVPFERLMDLLTLSQERLMASLDKVTLDDLAQLPASSGDRTIGSRLNGLAWHETYHTGQTEYTRQISGKDDRIL